MQDEVVYNQVLTVTGGGIDSRMIMRSHVEEGKLILVLDDGDKLLIDGKNVDTVDHKDRIQELLSDAQRAGVVVDTKAVTHYASTRTEDALFEYVLIKW